MCLIAGLVWGACSVNLALAEEKVTAVGKVTGADGKPVDHATVLVYSAHVKRGYGVYCPTCWVDCGKHAVTGADGSFAIPGLNPDLRFTLLVVKDGYIAAYVENVDPAKGPAQTASLAPRAPVADTSQVVRGRVVDAHGGPLRDAIVEEQGVTLHGQYGLMHSFGSRDWIDRMAATNEKGEFEMAYGKPAVAMTLIVAARGMAPKLVTEPTGADRKAITVTEGATIRGRLVQPDGKPAAGGEVGLSSHSRASGTSFPEISIGTKEDGTFAITNVPAGRIWYLYPKMESLSARGFAGGVMPCETRNEGEEVDVGDIHLLPGYTLRGKVALSDGKPIPPETRVTLTVDWGCDDQMTVLAPDGTFEFKGLAKGVYSLAAGVQGYSLADERIGAEVLVDRDRKDIVIRMEPEKKGG